MALATNKYKKQWEIASFSNPDKKYKVSLTQNDHYECSCRRWCTHVPRENCKHISAVLNGDCEEESITRCEMIPASVGQVEKRANNTFYVPLVPFGDINILSTLIYDLLVFGVPWSQVKKRYGHLMGKNWTRDRIIAHVKNHGRYIYTAWKENIGWTGCKCFPVE